MTKETVRFPDGLVDRIRSAVDDSELFESRSEFHRVSSELLLDLLDPDHEPTNFSYRELRTEIEAELGVDLAGAPSLAGEDAEGESDDGEFLAAYIDVRRRALGGNLAGAREEIDRRYDAGDPEALLLDEVIGQYREEGQVVAADSGVSPDTDPEPASGDGTRDRPEPAADARGSRERPPTSADGGEPGGDDETAERDHADGRESRRHGE